MSNSWTEQKNEFIWNLRQSGISTEEIINAFEEKFGEKRTNSAINSRIHILKKEGFGETLEKKKQFPQLSDPDYFKELSDLDKMFINQRENKIEDYLQGERNTLYNLDKSSKFNKLSGLSIEDALSMNKTERSKIISYLQNPEKRIIIPEKNTRISLIKIPNYGSNKDSNKLILPVYDKEIITPSNTLISAVHDISLDVLARDADIKKDNPFRSFARYDVTGEDLDWRRKAREISQLLKDNYVELNLKFVEDKPLYKN